MSSDHFDGEITDPAYQAFWLSGREKGRAPNRAVKALLELKEANRRGPGRGFSPQMGRGGHSTRSKPGPVWLSHKTGAPGLHLPTATREILAN